MSEELWTQVDAYLGGLLVPHDAALDAAVIASTAAGLPAIQVTPPQGKLLYLLALMRGARRILEIGTLGGYSTIWMARALAPGGRLITIEMDSRHAEVARSNFERAGLSRVIELREGKAIDVLPKIAAEAQGPFDLSFIDADKAGNAEYFDWAVRLSQPGSLIVVDNVVREGSVVDSASTDASVLGTRRLVERVAAERRVSATAIQTVGAKGYDGFLLAQVIAGSSG